MLKGILVFVFFFTLILTDPTPPPPRAEWPTEFSSWVVTTVTEKGLPGPGIIKNKGQNIVFSLSNQYSCRYNEQNLLTKSKARPTDMCDFKTGYHWSVNDTTQNSVCDGSTAISGQLVPITWPPEFLARAKFMGTNTVTNLNCSHWWANNLSILGQTIQMDVWVDLKTGFPCQMSIFENGTKYITTWAFDGFTDEVPAESKICTAPKVVCSESDWKCQAKPDETNDNLGAALQWVCDPQHLDCTPINPGGSFFEPNSVLAHANWAFSSYYEKHKAEQGEYACDFGGAGQLVPPSSSTSHKLINKRDTQSALDYINLFSDDIVCADIRS